MSEHRGGQRRKSRHVSYRLSSPAEAQQGLLLFVFVVLTAVGSHLPCEPCEERVRMAVGTAAPVDTRLHQTHPQTNHRHAGVNTHSQNTQDEPMDHLDISDSPSVKPQLMRGRKKGQNLSETYQTQHLEPCCSGVQLLAILHEKKTANTQIIYQACNLLIRVIVLIYKAACKLANDIGPKQQRLHLSF